MADNDEGVELPLLFTGVDDTPILLANQFAGQVEPGLFTLIVGQMSVPLLIGTPEERREQAERVSYVPVKVLGRYSMTEGRLLELIQMLNRQLSVLQEQQQEDEYHAK